MTHPKRKPLNKTRENDRRKRMSDYSSPAVADSSSPMPVPIIMDDSSGVVGAPDSTPCAEAPDTSAGISFDSGPACDAGGGGGGE